jgi:hypothetical protein
MPGKTRKANTNVSIKCEKVYCADFVRRQKKMAMQMLKQTLKTIKNPRLQKTLKRIAKKGHNYKKSMEVCKQGYCNPGCKGTLYQDGKTIAPAALKAIANVSEKATRTASGKAVPPGAKKFMMNTLKETRKGIFKGKSSVLRNSFYEKLPPANVAKAKKKGALSGCTLSII